ncbi:MAG: hypothetical protein WD872_12400 [Pirellulaceae bacterium]
MTTIQARLIGDSALVPRTDFEHLVEIARRCEPIDLQIRDDDVSTEDMMRLADAGGAFKFWLDAGEDIYTVEDGEPV